MRDPTLNGETKPYTDARNGMNGNTLREPDHDAFDAKNVLNNRPKSAAGLDGTYDELYHLQNGTSDTNVGPRQRSERVNKIAEEDLLHMRHGWHDEYTSNEYLSLLNSVCNLTSF
jgi:hypothetical protein